MAQELFERLEIGTTKDRKFIITMAANYYDRTYSDGVYRFVFAISYAIEKVRNAEGGEEYKKICQLIQNFLSSDKILIEAKYIFLNAFVNKNRGASSSTGLRLNYLFEEIVDSFDLEKSKQLKELIKKVFLDAKNRYFLGNKSVYENEENFSYVLYQSWNGKKDSPKNLSAIIKAAERDLEKYPQAINYYWKITFNKLDINSTNYNEDLGSLTPDPEQLHKITERSIGLVQDQSLKDELLNNLARYKKILENDKNILQRPQIEAYKQEAAKTLMMAMIEQNFIEEKDSEFLE